MEFRDGDGGSRDNAAEMNRRSGDENESRSDTG